MAAEKSMAISLLSHPQAAFCLCFLSLNESARVYLSILSEPQVCSGQLVIKEVGWNQRARDGNQFVRIFSTLNLIRNRNERFPGQLKLNHKKVLHSFKIDLKETISLFFK